MRWFVWSMSVMCVTALCLSGIFGIFEDDGTLLIKVLLSVFIGTLCILANTGITFLVRHWDALN